MTVCAHVQMAALKLGHRRLKLQRSALQGRAAAPAPSIPLDIYVTAVWIHLFADCAALPSLCRISLMLLWQGEHKTAFYFYFIPPLGFKTLSRISSRYLHVTSLSVT